MGESAILSLAVMVVVAMFGLFGWVSIAATALTPNAQGRRARLIGVQFCAFALVTLGLWAIQRGAPDIVFFLYLHAAVVAALDLALLRWRRWRLWAGIRIERSS